MRRLLAIAITLLAAGICAAVAVGSSGGSSSGRFDVIFDDARGLVGGQLVKIASARAGVIQNVVVTPDYKARIEATVNSRFLPFRQDATCTIRPEGLIAENYVDCDPGTPASPPLKASGGHPPTVPVSNTTEPVSLLDLFNIFNLPTRQRFMVIVDELGIGTSGRGTDFNEILRRANPALALARQVIGILSRQRDALARLIDATDTIAAEGAGNTGALQSFLDRAAALSTITADHSSSLSEGIRRLPRLLAVAQPALQQLDVVASQGTPLLQQINAAVPSLNKVSNDLPPFVSVAKPALAKLSVALTKAIPAIQETVPLVRTLRIYSDRSRSGTILVGKLFANLQRHGFVENFLSVTYYIAASLSRFDSTSHMLPLLLVGANNGTCGNYTTTPVPICSAHYGRNPPYKPSREAARSAANQDVFGATDGGSFASSLNPSTISAQSTLTGSLPSLPALTDAQRKQVQQLIQQILHRGGRVTRETVAELAAVLRSGASQSDPQTLHSLLDYLVK